MRTKMSTRFLALPFAALLFLAACGGGDDSSDDAATDDTEMSTTTSTTEAPSDQDSDDGSDDGSSDVALPPGITDNEFCRGVYEAFQPLDDFDDTQVDGDPGAAYREIADALGSVDAPSEIEDDWATVVEVFDQFASAFDDFDPTDPESFDQEAMSQIEGLEGELQTAAANIEAYVSEECGIDETGL